MMGTPNQAMLMFTEDGWMIAGLATSSHEPAVLLRQLASVVGGRYGVIVLEERPPPTMDAFEEMCRNAQGPRLVDGAWFA
jgi:hypothetical protein